MRAEQVEPEKKGLGARSSPLEPFDGPLHRAHRAGVFVAGGPKHGPVAKELLPANLPEITIGVVLLRQTKARFLVEPHVLRPGITRDNVRVVPLAPHPDRFIEPASVSEPCLSQQGDVRDQGGMDPLVPEDVGQNLFLGAERRPTLRFVGETVAAGPPASAGGKRRQVFGEVMVEDDPLRGQTVEVGRFDPGIAVGTDEAEMQAVADDDDDVHESIQVGAVSLNGSADGIPPIRVRLKPDLRVAFQGGRWPHQFE